MALEANIFNNYLSKIEDVTLCLLCSDNNSPAADSLLYKRGQNLLGQPKEMLLARTISSPL